MPWHNLGGIYDYLYVVTGPHQIVPWHLISTTSNDTRLVSLEEMRGEKRDIIVYSFFTIVEFSLTMQLTISYLIRSPLCHVCDRCFQKGAAGLCHDVTYNTIGHVFMAGSMS